MTSFVRSSNLDAYEALTRSIGLDPAAEIARSGLPVDALHNEHTLIPFIGFIRLLEFTALAGNCPDFGLRLAQRQGAGNAGPLLILMRHAATLEEAIQAGSRHLFVLSPNYLFSIVAVRGEGGLVDLTIDIDVPQIRLRPQATEHALGYMMQLLRLVSQGRAQPLLAMLPHPRLGPLRSYTEVLGCPCRFDAQVATIRMAAKDLSLPLPDRNPLLQRMALSYIEEYFGAPDKLFSDQVRLLARRFLDTGEVSQRDIANALAVHPKTLQRRLLAEGQVFNNIVDEVRRGRFLELIADAAGPSVAQLAHLLGYSEQAALTRSCRRWFGKTPSELRRQTPTTLAHGA